MATLTGQSIASSYEQLLHVDADGGGNTTTHVSVKDGDNGTTFALTLATDAVMITSTNRLEFGDDGTYIHQSADGVLDLVSDTEIEINATDVDMNGALDLDGTFTQDAGNVVFNEAGADYDFRVEGVGQANALFVDGASGNVGIGVTPEAWTVFTVLQIEDSAVLSGRSGSNQADFANNWYYDGTEKRINTGYVARYTQNTTGDHQFFTAGTDSADSTITFGTAKLHIDNDGDVTFTGDLIMADGKGIDFSADASPATGMTAEILDDYEEGTWDPVVSDGSNPMTMDSSYDTGYYTKVGNLVTVTGLFSTTSLGSASGSIRITGLPFTVANNMAAYSAGTAAYGAGLAIAAGHSVSYYGAINTTIIVLNVWDATTGITGMQASEWTADGGIILGFSYRAA
jgi:hypothetical protein